MLLGILNSQAAGGGGGGFDLLETTTLTSSASSVTFSGLDSYAADYKHLQIRYTARSDRSSGVYSIAGIRLNSDTGSNYSYHQLYGTGSSVGSTAAANQTTMRLGIIPESTDSANVFGSGIVDLLDFTNTSKNTTIKSFSGEESGSNSDISLWSGAWYNTAAVTTAQLIDLAGNFVAGSRFSLYGVK